MTNGKSWGTLQTGGTARRRHGAEPKPVPWDQRLARVMVRPLARTPVTPNQITGLTLVLALAGAALFGVGAPWTAGLGAGLFVLARFLDHFDGEVARLKGQSSRLGYYYDHAAGAASYGALFLGMGVGLRDGALAEYAIALGLAGAVSAVACMFLNLEIDKTIAPGSGRDTAGYPAAGGVELEDGIYLLAPITWLGWLEPFFALAAAGAVAYGVWTGLVAWRRPAAPRHRVDRAATAHPQRN